MNSEISLLVDSAGRFLGAQAPVSRLRGALRDASSPGFSRERWREAGELGLTGLMVPESAGGFGLGAQAAGAVIELCGRHLVPEPFLSGVCLAAPVLAAAATDRATEILGELATGEAVVAVAVPDADRLRTSDFSIAAKRVSGGQWALEGELPMVVDAPQSDWIIFPATSNEDVGWFALSTAGLSRTDGVLMDGRRASRVTLDTVVDETALLGVGADGGKLTEAFLTVGAALVSAWLLGAAEQAFVITLDHLKTRRQFGATLGSFQALQHRMAILYCELTVARAVTEAALMAVDANAPNAPLLASAAKTRSAATADLAASEGIQMFGALGMTEEADIGFYYKAARIGDLLAGHRFFHKERAARLLGLGNGAP